MLAVAAKRVKLDGFRAGKVPLSIARQHLDEAKLFEEAANQLLPAAYTAALKKLGKTPMTQPDVRPQKTEQGQDWVFVAAFAERPEITLGKYKQAVRAGLKASEQELKEHEKKAGKNTAALAGEDKSAAVKKPIDTEQVKLRHIFQHLIEHAKPRIPELFIRQEVTSQLQRLSEQLEKLHVTAEQYLASRNLTAEALQQEMAVNALASLQVEFLLAEIAKTEHITVTDQEIDTLLHGSLGDHTETQHQNAQLRSYIFSMQLRKKVSDMLLKLGE